jgi:sec-independent protein translocase protein TatB
MGSTELLLIGLVALIVVGPKELPGMFRMLGQATGKIRKMAREFTRAMEDAADDAGVGDLTSSLRNIADPRKMGLDAVKKQQILVVIRQDRKLRSLRNRDLRKLRQIRPK